MGGNMGDFGMGSYGSNGGNDQNESEAILKIKQSMEEESKRFEKDSDHPDYFMQWWNPKMPIFYHYLPTLSICHTMG